jgi:6-phosphogluconolactonase
MNTRRIFLCGLFAATVSLSALQTTRATANEDDRKDDRRDDRNGSIGAIYTASNATTDNQILAFDQMRDGSLKPMGSVSTGGKGSGGGLGNQSGLTLTSDRRLLLAVNAGSNEISVLKFNDRKPKLVSKVASGGTRPVSITVQGDLVYVLNAGSDDVTGFYLKENGQLYPIPNSRRALSGKATAPAQIRFSPDGRSMVVTEKATNIISTFPVKYGYLGDRISNPSSANTPFGFAFDRRGNLLVSEAAGGPPNISSISSYDILENSKLKTITPSAKTTNQLAACWVVVSKNGKYAYTSNTASGTISGFAIKPDGMLTGITPDGITGNTGTGSGPIDMIISRNGQYLSSLNTGNGTIANFRVEANGSLKPAPTLSNIPTSSNGLVAR